MTDWTPHGRHVINFSLHHCPCRKGSFDPSKWSFVADAEVTECAQFLKPLDIYQAWRMHSFPSLWIPPLHHCGITAPRPGCLIQYLSSPVVGCPCCESAPWRSLYQGTINPHSKGTVPTNLLPPFPSLPLQGTLSSKQGKEVSLPRKEETAGSFKQLRHCSWVKNSFRKCSFLSKVQRVIHYFYSR